MYKIITPHKNVSVISFQGAFVESKWPMYEADFRNVYRVHDRAVIVFDLRGVEVDMSTVVQFAMLKKSLLTELKADTCRMLLAAVVLTQYDFIRDIVMNIVKASGQASLFYAFSDLSEAVTTINRLVAVINNQRLPLSRPGALRWKDVSSANITALLLSFFLRISRHFLLRQKMLKKRQ